MLPFRQIYFDSDILVASGWPELSTELQNVLRLAEMMKLKTLLLDPVERELEAHWMRDFEKTQQEADRKASNLGRLLAKVGSAAELQMPSQNEVRAQYRVKVEQAIKLSMERAPITRRPLDEVFELSVQRRRPFTDKDKGFQDAVICLSAIDHLAQSEDKTGAFVSRDTAFDQQAIESLAESAGVQLILYKELESIQTVFYEELKQAIRTVWDEDRQRAIGAAQRDMELLHDFIRKNLEIPERLGRFEIVRVLNVEAVEVSDARTPFPLERKEGEPVTLSLT